jgi:hypothetical protein
VLQSDLNGVRVKPTLTNDILLESKQEMRKRGVRSPDLGDALALTFASIRHIGNEEKPQKKKPDDFVAGSPENLGRLYQKEFENSHNSWMG